MKLKKVHHYKAASDRRRLKQIFFETAAEEHLKESTTYKYWRWVRRLILAQTPPIHPAQLNDQAILRFISEVKAQKLSASSTRQAANALQFLYSKVLPARPILLRKISELIILNEPERAAGTKISNYVFKNILRRFLKLH